MDLWFLYLLFLPRKVNFRRDKICYSFDDSFVCLSLYVDGSERMKRDHDTF